MKRLLFIMFFAAILGAAATRAWDVPDETLHYEVRFKWGFIDANAGIAELKTVTDTASHTFRATLTGKSVNLLGHYYAAGDTIRGTLMSDRIQSVYTEHLSQADGMFAIQTITYPGAGSASEGEIVTRYPDGKVLRERISHYGGGVTVDLLGVFYYIRQLDYEQMTPGTGVTVNILYGSDAETLKVDYKGKVMADSCGSEVPAYAIGLTFSSPTSAHTSQMDVSISADTARIPLVISGSLKVGQIFARLINPSAD